jgi:hypothetical protein
MANGEGSRQPRALFDAKTGISLLLFIFLIAKVYGVAGFSLTTAAGLVTVAPLAVLTGIVIIYAYVLIAFFAVFLGWLFILGVSGRDDRCQRFAPLIFILMLFAVLLSPWRYLVDALIAVAVALLLAWILDRLINVIHAGGSPSRLPKIIATVVLAEILIFVLATIGKPWVPAEVVMLSTPISANPTAPDKTMTSKPVVFIVSESNGRVTMLIDDSRYLVSVPEDTVKHRMVCHLNDQLAGANPWLESIFHQPYQTHNISCWRCTDQAAEQARQAPSLVTRILTWQFKTPAKELPGNCKALLMTGE